MQNEVRFDDLSPLEAEIKAKIDAAIHGRPIGYNPDRDLVRRILRGLAKRQEKSGLALCPCRIASGVPEQDQTIVCPCQHHEREILEQGMCHCQLLVAAK